MTEDEYVKVTNLVKLRVVNNLLRDTLPGERRGISEDVHSILVYITTELLEGYGEIEINETVPGISSAAIQSMVSNQEALDKISDAINENPAEMDILGRIDEIINEIDGEKP